jgi:hypothetical protein
MNPVLRPAARRSLKTQQRERLAVSARCIEVDVIPGEFMFRTASLGVTGQDESCPPVLRVYAI